ncbi:MAG: hypothetical protein P4K86_00410 [Terracidiphilus sp.]|nr:hypothetical protein [Terracidiphilus sp.]MDR3775389.1 hypothetical protein [Terracidiphilus sp.]
MARLLPLVAALLLLPVPATATLVVLVPSVDGLVVAADSRTSVLGAQCDGQFKIVQLKRPSRTVVMVTGDGVFIPPPSATEPDLCRYQQSAPRLLDMAAVVTSYLERKGANPARLSLEDLGAECVRAAERFQALHPEAFQSHLGGEIFSVVLASYDPKAKVSTLRNFVVRISRESHKIEAARFSNITVASTDRRGLWAYGETDYVEKQVYGGFGRQFLTASTLDFILQDKPVAQASQDEAVAAAVNLIQAASRAAQQVPAASAIGGPIDVVLLGRKPRPQQLQWQKQ